MTKIYITFVGYKMSADDISTEDAAILTYHRYIEAMKFGFGKRSSLGDEEFVPVDEVANWTSHD